MKTCSGDLVGSESDYSKISSRNVLALMALNPSGLVKKEIWFVTFSNLPVVYSRGGNPYSPLLSRCRRFRLLVAIGNKRWRGRVVSQSLMVASTELARFP
jgi:hypothetical protein